METSKPTVTSMEPSIRIEFWANVAIAQKRWPNGRVEDMKVEDAMREFDRRFSEDA